MRLFSHPEGRGEHAFDEDAVCTRAERHAPPSAQRRMRVPLARNPLRRLGTAPARPEQIVSGALLTAANVGARYGASVVLRGIDIHVRQGEIVTILGANGAGKTTFLGTVMGLVTMTSGHVFLDDRDITRLSPEARVNCGVALCPEGRRIFARMTVEENLRLGAGLTHQHHFVESSERVFDLFPVLHTLRDRHAGFLSGGEQQQLAVARALMSRPKLLLLDEPSLGLAPVIVSVIFELIGRLRDEGTTILLVEQNVRAALQVADRAYVLNTGRLELSGTAEELRRSASVEEAYLGLAVEL
jgi:branched-chain amino acid transport system ATP-binding protein